MPLPSEQYKLWKEKLTAQGGLIDGKNDSLHDNFSVEEIETTNHYLGSHNPTTEAKSLNLLLVKDLKNKIACLSEEAKSIPFDKMELSVRSNNILFRENIFSPEVLLKIPDEEIVRWHGLGEKSIQDILGNIALISSQTFTKYTSLKENDKFLSEKDEFLKNPSLDDFLSSTSKCNFEG